MDLSERLTGFTWRQGALHIANPDAISRVRRKNLSASVANDMRKCPASVAVKSVLPRISDPFSPAELGTGAHAVLELLYTQEPAERTREFVTTAAEKVGRDEWAEDKLAERTPEALLANTKLREQWTAIVTEYALKIFEMEDPTQVRVHAVEMDLRDIVFADGVPGRGFLDRVVILVDEDGSDILALDDYKFGKWRSHNPRFDDDYGDQQRMYAELLRIVTGALPARARLIYPLAGKVRPIDLSPAPMRQTITHLSTQWKQLNQFSDEGVFPAKPSALCGWCPVANSCPVAQLKTDKAKAAAATQYTAVELGIPVIRPGAAAPAEIAATKPAHLDETPRIERVVATTLTEQEPIMTATASPLQYPASEYAAMAAFSITDTAVAHLDQHGQTLSPTTIASFTHVLAGILTRAERALFGNVGWEHGKHARLGHALGQSITMRPAPFGGTAAEWQEWASRMETMLNVKARVALGLLAVDEFSPDAYEIFVAPTPATV